MDEPCDWDVCTEASIPGPLTQTFSRTEKKRHVKTEIPASGCIKDEALEHSIERKSSKIHPAPRQAEHVDGNKKVSSAKDALPQRAPEAAPTRKELQDALPKIPPLSSFKDCRSRFMTFEEAQQDFQDFITRGPGRSVEVIREFRGREDNGTSDHCLTESVTLDDDEAQTTHKGQAWKSNVSHAKSLSHSSSSHSDMEESQQDDDTVGSSRQTQGGEFRAIVEAEARQRPSVLKPKQSSTRIKDCPPSAPTTHHQTTRASDSYVSGPSIRSNEEANQTASAQTINKEPVKMKEHTEKRGKKLSERMETEQKRGRDEEEQDSDEEECSAEAYWRACYRAWNDYYASMSPFEGQGHQSYYNVAHNWMAAYRMNAVYMDELMKY